MYKVVGAAETATSKFLVRTASPKVKVAVRVIVVASAGKTTLKELPFTTAQALLDSQEIVMPSNKEALGNETLPFSLISVKSSSKASASISTLPASSKSAAVM